MKRWRVLVSLVVVALAVAVAGQEQQELIIRNGVIVNATGRREADIRVRNGTIAEIGRGLTASSGAREINAKGMQVIPGGIDPHTHIRNSQGCFCMEKG